MWENDLPIMGGDIDAVLIPPQRCGPVELVFCIPPVCRSLKEWCPFLWYTSGSVEEVVVEVCEKVPEEFSEEELEQLEQQQQQQQQVAAELHESTPVSNPVKTLEPEVVKAPILDEGQQK